MVNPDLLPALILLYRSPAVAKVETGGKVALERVMSMNKLLAVSNRLARNEEGATLMEYGLMLALIALVCFSAVQSLGVNVQALFTSVSASL